MPLNPGVRIGPYEVFAPLGAGGMGEVYRARDPRLGRDVADDYFSDGLADELLSVLARLRSLRVAAPTSSSTFKGKSVTIEEVGRALNVDCVLEGSVRKSGNRVRMAVQLVKVADGYLLWSESYDRTLEDVIAVQDDIAQSVVKELRTALLGEAPDPCAPKWCAIPGEPGMRSAPVKRQRPVERAQPAAGQRQRYL